MLFLFLGKRIPIKEVTNLRLCDGVSFFFDFAYIQTLPASRARSSAVMAKSEP